MSRHRNVRKLNIAEELEEDDEDDFYDYEEEKPISPETSKFLYQRPEFPTNQQQKQTLQIQQQQVGIAEPEEWEEYVDEGDEMFQMDEVVQPLKKPQATKSKPNSTREQQLKAQSAAKQQQPIVAVAPAVENLRINETAKVRSSSKSPGRTATPKQTLSNLEVAIAATPKYKQRTRRRDEKQALNLVIVGHVDAGKSTLVGHLLYLLGNVDERSMHRYRQDSSQMGKSSFAFAWILDESEEERTRGVTMDIAHTSFLSPNGQKFNILDAPGHKDFIPNMISGATQADAALLVVNATRGEFETGFDQGGQTREHALLIRALGVSRLVVAINKLDTVDWSQDRFDELCAILSAFLLKRAGFESVQFVPVSGLLGVNLSTAPPSDHPLTQWHSTVQQTLVQALDSLPLSASSSSGAEQPLRAVCTDVLRYAPAQLVLSAKVECGHVEPGDRLFLMPEANPVTVKAVSIDEPSSSSSAGSSAALSALATAATKSADQKQVCFAGDQATLTLAGAFEPDTIHPGHVLCRGGSELVMPCRHFRARLVTFDIQMPILRGTVAELFVQSLRVPCVISHLRVLHPGSKELEKRNPRLLPRNVSAIVDIRTEQPISVEPFARSKSLGRIALRAGGQTIAAGIVLELCL